jgi:large subunit ribosomal protein L17
MRHRVHRQSLGVTREHRAAMLANMSTSLITHGRIKTTITKAKALRPFIEKIVTKAKKAAAKTEKKDKLHLRRLAMADVRDEAAVSLLFDEKVSEFENRPGGYTRIYKLGPRQGDAAEMALIEFVKADDPGYKKPKKKGASKAKKAASGAAEAESDKPAEEVENKAEEAEVSASAEAKADEPAAAEAPADEPAAAEAPADEPAAAEATADGPAAAEEAPEAEASSDEEEKKA